MNYNQQFDRPALDDPENESAANSHPRTGRLHSLRGITWATLFGGPLLTLLLLTLNYRRLRMRRETRLAASALVMAFFAYFMWMSSIPEYDERPDSLFYAYLPISLITLVIAIRLQRDLVNEHRQLGGVVLSAWDSIFVVLLFYGAFVALVCFLNVVYPQDGQTDDVDEVPREVLYGEDSVYYLGEIRDFEAYRLGAALHELEYFQDNGRAVRLSRENTKHIVSFVVADREWDDKDIRDYHERIGQQLLEALDWDILSIQLTDANFDSYEEFSVMPKQASTNRTLSRPSREFGF